MSGLAEGAILTLSSCSSQPSSITLSGGIDGSYYNRLGEQINNSTKATVKVCVKSDRFLIA
ncbi:MAG: hypothetical protein KME22_25045 [Hassallia sp. WJT32-NPBG1]|nr:hypothetical protein [Hassallia sp. WJT32-NPBG1]